ncbi:MAG: sigma-70 family RNA polymerase sigma factor [Anaerolineae bacterium]|nr:sigma-70 family RNA polymerase sigma factor [Anaerolineae bacterium]
MDVDKLQISTEQQLIQQLQLKTPEALALLVELYTDDVYRFIYNQVGGSVQDTEDLVQETFLAAMKALRRFRGDSKIRTWLFSIAAHKVTDRYRHWGRRPSVPIQTVAFSLLAETPPPEQRMEHNEANRLIRQALLELPPHYRTALVLKYIEEMSVKEMAKIMHRSEKSVESILVRARRMLTSLFEGKYAGA